jgi:neutral ceramidase
MNNSSAALRKVRNIGTSTMKAGFSKVCITPPIGTTMYGFATRDRECGCKGIYDDIFARALYLSHGEEEVLIIGFDLLFFNRAEADRYKGAIGRRMELLPRQILLNTSHTHAGPMVGTAWTYAQYGMADPFYIDELEQAIVKAACQARAAACEVTMWAGATSSALPLSRRRKDEGGRIYFEPSPSGTVCDSLPLCLFKDLKDKPVALLFSISCHPSTISGYEISSDYPGVAMDLLDKYLGTECSLFLQGTGGDTKASVIGQGEKWSLGTWDDVSKAGDIVAREAIEAIERGLVKFQPHLKTGIVDMNWPLEPAQDYSWYKAIADDTRGTEWRRLWAQRQVDRLDRGQTLATSVPIILHGIGLGNGLRLIGLEGEAVAGLGIFIQDFYKDGITFALGYTNGAQLYLPTSTMLDEGGYEVVSYWEYGWPAPFAKGFEDIIVDGLKKLRTWGVE